MLVKNYYKILEVSPSASQQEIKTAYRKLVFKYHPDKNPGDSFAESHFKEIQEAYFTLSDNHRRAFYNQKRWYSRHEGSAFKESLSVFTIDQKLTELLKYLRKVERSGVNKKPLYHYVKHLLSHESLTSLQQYNEPAMKLNIIETVLHTTRYMHLKHASDIIDKLNTLVSKDIVLLQLIDKARLQIKNRSLWQQLQMPVILLVTILLCWLIYMISEY
jgi:hypothetical protein